MMHDEWAQWGQCCPKRYCLCLKAGHDFISATSLVFISRAPRHRNGAMSSLSMIKVKFSYDQPGTETPFYTGVRLGQSDGW